MNKNKLYLIASLALGTQLSLPLNSQIASSQTPQTLAQLPKPKLLGGISPKRKPAGTRGPCEEMALPFTPVLPDPDPEFSGLTLQSHPTFWFYIPYHSDRVSSGRFSLELETDDGEGSASLWRTDFRLPPTPGFVSVTLPKTAKALEEGKTYKWYFTLYCNNERNAKPDKNQESDIVFHRGSIIRARKADFTSDLNANPSLAFYLEHKIWYDAANNLANIRRSPQQWNLFLDRMDMSAWREEKVSGVLYSNLR